MFDPDALVFPTAVTLDLSAGLVPNPVLEAAWGEYLAEVAPDAPVSPSWDDVTGADLEHLALYHDEEGRYYGLSHRCSFVSTEGVF